MTHIMRRAQVPNQYGQFGRTLMVDLGMLYRCFSSLLAVALA